ncbi:MAG: hypothetical protein H0X29_05710 [Parachlamydiaceae bacterium]|nr:hypothetical protein [Parachlamydiaceae bacterium]
MSEDISTISNYANVTFKPETSTPIVPEKKSLWKQFKQKLGIDFDAKAFIKQINEKTTITALSTKYDFSAVSLKVGSGGSAEINKLRNESVRAKKIATECLKLKPPNSIKTSIFGSRSSTSSSSGSISGSSSIGSRVSIDNVESTVFLQMAKRADEMNQQLDCLENVNKLKVANSELAPHLEELYTKGKIKEGDAFLTIALTNPGVAKFLLDPRAKENPKFYAEFYKLASDPKTMKHAATIAHFLSNPKIQREFDFFPSMCAILSNPDKLNIGLKIINLFKNGTSIDAKSEEAVYKASMSERMKNFINNWETLAKPKNDHFDTALPTVPVDFGDGQILHVEKDHYNERLQQMRMEVDGALVWKGDSNWKASMPAEDKKVALSAFHDNLTQEMNKHTDTPLTKQQSLNVTSCLLRLSSVNGLSQTANSHKIEILKGDFGAFQAGTASSGFNPMGNVDLNPGSVFKMTFEPNGMVVLKGPVTMEKVITQDGPRFFGIQTEVRMHIDDLKNIQMKHTDPSTGKMLKGEVPDPKWNVTTTVSSLCESPEDLIAEVGPEYLLS